VPAEKATDRLSDEARLVMLQGFAAGRTAAFIVQAIHDATGEEVAERTLARRAAEWRAEVERRKTQREFLADLVASAEGGGTEASACIRALALQALETNPEALSSADPIELQGLALDAEKLRMQKRSLDLRERQVAVTEKKLAILEARDARVKAVAEKPELSAEERVAEIQAIYGIRKG